jgi:hypothetical protein
MVEGGSIDNLLAKEITEFQELGHGSPISKIFFHLVEKGEFLFIRFGIGWRGHRLWYDRGQGGLNERCVHRQWFVYQFGSLVAVADTRTWSGPIVWGRWLCWYGGLSGCGLIRASSFLAFLRCTWRWSEAPQRRHLLTRHNTLRRMHRPWRSWSFVTSATGSDFSLPSGFREKLLEILQ